MIRSVCCKLLNYSRIQRIACFLLFILDEESQERWCPTDQPAEIHAHWRHGQLDALERCLGFGKLARSLLSPTNLCKLTQHCYANEAPVGALPVCWCGCELVFDWVKTVNDRQILPWIGVEVLSPDQWWQTPRTHCFDSMLDSVDCTRTGLLRVELGVGRVRTRDLITSRSGCSTCNVISQSVTL